MPTGYTAGIEDGKITTGKDFLMLCTRAFGVAMDVRDEPLSVPTPTKFEPNTFYRDKIDREKIDLEKWERMSFENAKTKMIEYYTDRVKLYKQIAESNIEKNKKYAKVRTEVEAWNPPTENHYNLKKFALEQIDMCIEKQEWIDEWLRLSNEELDDSDEAVEIFINERIESCRRSVEYSEEKWEAELKKAEDNNIWMQQLLESLQ